VSIGTGGNNQHEDHGIARSSLRPVTITAVKCSTTRIAVAPTQCFANFAYVTSSAEVAPIFFFSMIIASQSDLIAHAEYVADLLASYRPVKSSALSRAAQDGSIRTSCLSALFNSASYS